MVHLFCCIANWGLRGFAVKQVSELHHHGLKDTIVPLQRLR